MCRQTTGSSGMEEVTRIMERDLLIEIVGGMTTIVDQEEMYVESGVRVCRTYDSSGGNNSSRRTQSQDRQPRNDCPRCGYNHTPYQQCQAMGKTCGNCGKLNHFWSCCRQARGGWQQH